MDHPPPTRTALTPHCPDGPGVIPVDTPVVAPPGTQTPPLAREGAASPQGTTVARRLGEALLGLLLPVQCVGCGTWDHMLCPGCAELARGPVTWEVLDGSTRRSDLGLWSLGEYGGALRGLVLAAKHRPAVDLTAFLCAAGCSLGAGIGSSGVLGGVSEAWVVPAPSGWRRRHRAQMVAPLIADGVARGVADATGARAQVVDLLALRPLTGSQSGRSGGQRRAGRLDSMRARVEVPEGTGVVLVDDVVTTGATMREMARLCGVGTVGAVALCHAGRGGRGRSPARPYDPGHAVVV